MFKMALTVSYVVLVGHVALNAFGRIRYAGFFICVHAEDDVSHCIIKYRLHNIIWI